MKSLTTLISSIKSSSPFVLLGLVLCIGVIGSCKNSEGLTQKSSQISVKAFGATGNGRTDDALAIQSAIQALPSSGGVLVFEPGTYLLGRGLVLTKKKNFQIRGPRAVLIAKDGLKKVPVNAMFTIEDCDNFEIKGLTLNGNRDKRPTVADQSPCHNFRILDVRDADFVNITSINSMQDGFTLQDKPTNPLPVRRVRFVNCVAKNSFRQGLSVINGSKISILGGEYSGTHGVGPEAGIDIEANKGEAPNEDIYFKGVTFRDNASYGIILSHKANSKRMYVDSCFFYGNAGGILVTVDGAEITRCVIEGKNGRHSSDSKWFQGTALLSVKFGVINSVVIRDNIFRNVPEKYFGIWVASKVARAEIVGNRFIQMPRTALAVYGKKAYIIGNTFVEGRNRDIQLKGGEGHVVGCNTFKGKGRALMLVETEGVLSIGNTFNQRNIPKKLLQQYRPLETTISTPTTSARSSSTSQRNIPIRGEDRVVVDATQQVTVTLPARPQNRVILIKRAKGQSPIVIKSNATSFITGANTETIKADRQVAFCYYDGTYWRVY